MGTCMSRCASSSQEEQENVQDKLVISQTPLPTFHPSSPKQSQASLSSPPSKQVTSSSPTSKQNTPPSPPSKQNTPPSSPSKQTTPSSLSTTSSTTASCITTTSFSYSYTLSSASSSGVTNDDEGEISGPRSKKNARSSPTDRRIRDRSSSTPKKNTRRFQKPSTKDEPPKLNVVTPQQPIPRTCARSPSPSLSRQRSNRNETRERYPSSASLSRPNLGSRSPCRSFKEDHLFHVQGDPRKENPKKKKNGVNSRSHSPFSSQRFLDGRSEPCRSQSKRRIRERRGGRSPSPSGGGRFNTGACSGHPAAGEKNWKKGARVAAMMENKRPRPVLSTTSNSGFCLEKGPQGDCDDHAHGDAISKKLQDMGHPVEEEEEDIDNPLISLDCFIFL